MHLVALYRLLKGSICNTEQLQAWFISVKANKTIIIALNIGHSTFGIFVQIDFNIGRGDIALLIFVPPDPRPPVPFVLFYDIEHLSFCYRDCSFILT